MKKKLGKSQAEAKELKFKLEECEKQRSQGEYKQRNINT
jgi:hypothetical protein